MTSTKFKYTTNKRSFISKTTIINSNNYNLIAKNIVSISIVAFAGFIVADSVKQIYTNAIDVVYKLKN